MIEWIIAQALNVTPPQPAPCPCTAVGDACPCDTGVSAASAIWIDVRELPTIETIHPIITPEELDSLFKDYVPSSDDSTFIINDSGTERQRS